MPIQQEKAVRTTITLTVDAEAWHAFRVACLMRKTSASKEITRFIRQELAAWSLPRKESENT